MNKKYLSQVSTFLFTVMFTISLQHVYVVTTVSRGVGRKKLTTYWVTIVTCVNHEK